MEESFEKMKDNYNKYIDALCNVFKIVDKKSFSEDIAKHIKNRPKNINEDTLYEWNSEFFRYVLKYSFYSLDQIKEIISIDANLLLAEIGKNYGS